MFDRPFILDGDTIDAGTDLEELDLLTTTKEFKTWAYCRYEFSDGALRRVMFDGDPYTVIFEGRTSDGEVLHSSETPYFRY